MLRGSGASDEVGGRPLVELKGVCKRFGRNLVLNHVDLRLHEGEILGLLGPNGSGKTTLLRLVMGFMPPDGGEVRVLGRDPFLEPEVRVNIGYVPEEVLLYDSLTVREFLYLLARMKKMKPGDYVDRGRLLVSLFEMEDKMDQLIGSLSRGDKQKLAVISALMHRPRILVLDEPLIGLDPVASRVLREILFRLKGRGGGILISTHMLWLAQSLCDRICIIHEGEIVASGRADEISEAFGGGKDLEEVFLKLTKEAVLERLMRTLEEGF